MQFESSTFQDLLPLLRYYNYHSGPTYTRSTMEGTDSWSGSRNHAAFIQPLERSPSANPSASAPPASKRCETCTIVSFQGRSDRHFGALSGHRWSSGYWICIRKHLWNLMNVWNWIWIANPLRHFVKTVSRHVFVKTLVRCSFHYANANPMIRIPGGGIFFSRKPAVSALEPAKPPARIWNPPHCSHEI